ncbi:hypothetical protein EV359DRAFT_83512 [Lentinula novae-zelandiae]|nr:hypothetical protein EV359DRAFT_83512 [Lentinula novae-zelandiae]
MRCQLALFVGLLSLAYAIPVEIQVGSDTKSELSSVLARGDSTIPLAQRKVLGRHDTLDARGILNSMPFTGKTKLAVTVTIPVQVPEAAKKRINSLIKAFLIVYRPLSNFEIELKDEADRSQKSGSAKFKVKLADKVQEWVLDYADPKGRFTKVRG